MDRLGELIHHSETTKLASLAGCLVLVITLNEVREGKISGIGRDNDLPFTNFFFRAVYTG